MCEVIPFMALMKEVYYIFDMHLPNPEVFLKYSKTIKVVFLSWSLNSSHQEEKILLLCIIIYKASYKNIYFGYIILINPNKQKIFSLSHSLERYSCTYKENYLHDDLKGETFVSTKGSIRIQRTNQNHNSNNWFNLNGSSYFEMPQKQFRYQKNVAFTF